MADSLDRRLGLPGSTAIGISAMVGAGLFVIFAPAVDAAGDGLFVALAIAAGVASLQRVVLRSIGERVPGFRRHVTTPSPMPPPGR